MSNYIRENDDIINCSLCEDCEIVNKAYHRGRNDQFKEDEELNYHYETSHECYMNGRKAAIKEQYIKAIEFNKIIERLCYKYSDEKQAIYEHWIDYFYDLREEYKRINNE